MHVVSRRPHPTPVRLLLVAVAALALTACRLDVDVEVTMQPDGTGEVVLVATADAELVAQVPDLVDDLRLDDAEANGWVVEGPTPVETGGMSIRLSHPFHTDIELASVLNSIGPPLLDMEAARTVAPEGGEGDGQTTNAINGRLGLPDGFRSFADPALIEAVGGQPFGEQLTASGATPADSMSFRLRLALPGELVSSETGRDAGDGVIEWEAPLDGTTLSLLTQTVQRPAEAGNGWAAPLSKLAIVLLVVWVVLAAAFIAFVAAARRSKRRRREHALRHLDR